ncbi:hypothetical protein AAC387_Pa12g1741 [Persea americana]
MDKLNISSIIDGDHPRPSTSPGDVTNARIHPALRILKQNLTLLTAILTERAQPLAVKEVMKATFEAFSMVLLAGGGSRMFSRTDHDMIAENIGNPKRVFCACGEGFIVEEVVEKEADVVEGVIALIGVLCHKNDNVANSFLKKTFQLAKRS